MNMYVGNLTKEVTEEALRKAFEEYGQVKSAVIIKDRYSGESRGFGFVEMQSKSEGLQALRELNGYEMDGQKLVISEARPKKDHRRKQKRYGGSKNY